MPWIPAAIAAFVAVAGKAIATFVIKAVISYAVGRIATELLAPKQKQAARQASIAALSLGEQSREAVFGLAQTGGTLVWGWNYGGKYGTDREVVVIAVADHLCDDLVGFWVDDRFYDFTTDGNHSDFFIGSKPQLAVYWRSGTADQVFPASLQASGGFTSNDLKGVAYVVFDYLYDTEGRKFSGRPAFKMLVKGKRCYDPRKDSTVGGSGSHRWTTPSTWEWTDNAYICRYNYTRGIYALDQVDHPEQLLIGRGLSAIEAPPERVFAPANICDELVPLKAGGSEKRYRVGGVIMADEDFITVEEYFAAAMAGQIIQPQGSIEIAPGASQAVVATITDMDLVIAEPVQWSDFRPKPNRVNTVTPVYIEPLQDWQPHSAPVRRSLADIEEDGEQHDDPLELTLVTSGTQAQRCGEIRRRRVRRERTRVATLPPWYSHLEEGDWFSWTSERFDEGQTRTWQIEKHVLGAGRRITVLLTEIAASDFAWTAAVDEITPGAALPPEPSRPDDLELDGVTAEPISVAGLPGIRLHWEVPVDPAVTLIRAEVRRQGQAEVTPTVTLEVNAGVIDITGGVGGDTPMEARLIPMGNVDRGFVPSAWHLVTPPGLIADDTDNVGGVPATEVIGEQQDLAEAALNEILSRSQVNAAIIERQYVGPMPAAVALAIKVTEEAEARAAALIAEVSDRSAAIAAAAGTLAAQILAEAAARGAAITAEQTTRQTADLSLASDLGLLTAALADEVTARTAAVSDEASARADGDGAEATARSILAAQVRGAYTGSDVDSLTSGLLYQERNARATADEALAEQITLLSAGVGEQFDSFKIWYFDSGVEGWDGNGAPTASAGWLRPANHASDPYAMSATGIGADGAPQSEVRMRVRKGGAPTWQGFLWWRSASDATWDAGRRVALTEPAWNGDNIGLVTVSPGWTGGIDRIRVDLISAQDSTNWAELDWVAIGRPAPGASTASLAAEQIARANADSALATDLLTLQASLGATNAAVAAETTARADGDSAEVTARQALSSKLTGATNPASLTLATLASGLLYDERQARVTADNAFATTLSSLNVQVGNNAAAITTEQTARANADAASALRIDTLFATSAGIGALNLDPTHQLWPIANSLPTNVATSGTAPTTTRLTTGNLYGEKALRGAATAVSSSGYARAAATMKPASPNAAGYVVCEWEVTLDAGDFRRAGFEYRLNYTSGHKRAALPLFDQHASPVAGRTYRGSKLVQLVDVGPTGSVVDQVDFLWLNNATLFTTQANSAKTVTFQRVAWRQATEEEVASGVTLAAAITAEQTARIAADSALSSSVSTLSATVSGHTASISTVSAAAADINGRLAATYSVLLDVGGKFNGFKIQSAGGGAVVNTFDITTDAFRVFNGSSLEPVFSVVGGEVFVGAEKVRTGSLIENAVTETYFAYSSANTLLTTSGVQYLVYRWYPPTDTDIQTLLLTVTWGVKLRGGANQTNVAWAILTALGVRFDDGSPDGGTIGGPAGGDAQITSYPPPNALESTHTWCNTFDWETAGNPFPLYLDFKITGYFGSNTNAARMVGAFLNIVELKK